MSLENDLTFKHPKKTGEYSGRNSSDKKKQKKNKDKNNFTLSEYATDYNILFEKLSLKNVLSMNLLFNNFLTYILLVCIYYIFNWFYS